MGQRFRIIELNAFICKEPQRPFAVSFRRITTGKSNDMCLNISSDLGWNRWGFPLFAGNGRVQSVICVRGSNVLNGSRGCVVCLCYFSNGHMLLIISVRGKQDIGTKNRLGWRRSFRNNILKNLPV